MLQFSPLFAYYNLKYIKHIKIIRDEQYGYLGPKCICRWEDWGYPLWSPHPDRSFFVALAVLRLKGHVAGAITLDPDLILIAIFAFKMPIDTAFAAAGYGFIYGLWPIAWIIVAAVFLRN
ncbi:L-lactate permease [Escherichia coli]